MSSQILPFKSFEFFYKETYGAITSENLEKLIAMVTPDNPDN